MGRHTTSSVGSEDSSSFIANSCKTTPAIGYHRSTLFRALSPLYDIQFQLPTFDVMVYEVDYPQIHEEYQALRVNLHPQPFHVGPE